MSKFIYAPVVSKTLQWARVQAGYSVEEIKKEFPRIRAWEEEDSSQKPTIKQLRKLSETFYHIPTGFFYQDETPKSQEFKRPVDFRSLDTTDDSKKWPPYLRWMIRQATDKQDKAREILEDEGLNTPAWMSRAGTFTNHQELGDYIASGECLGIASPGRRGGVTKFLKDLSAATEDILKIFIFHYRPDNNLYRRISQRLVSGLAMQDDLAPIISMNSNDTKTRRVFTLVHEIAHLLRSKPGVSTGVSTPDLEDEPSQSEQQQEETFCNRAASRALIPADLVANAKEGGIEDLSRQLALSRSAVAYRLYDIDRISWTRFKTLNRGYIAEWEERKGAHAKPPPPPDDKKKERGGGMSIPVRVRLENGNYLTRLVLRQYRSGGMSAIETSRFLRCPVEKFGDLAAAVDVDLGVAL